MRQIVLATLFSLLAWPALAQLPGGSEVQIDRTPVIGGTSPNCLYITSTNKVGQQACGGGTAANVTSGTTTVTGGTTSGIVWNNAGTLTAGPNRTTTTGSLTLGAADAASPVAQAISVQSVVTGTSNTAGVDWTYNGSQGTGTGAGGSMIFRTAPAGLTGSTPNSLSTALTLNASQQAVFANGTIALPAATFSNDLTTGLYSRVTATLGVTTSGAARAEFSGTGLRLPSTLVYAFSSTNVPSGSPDLGLSRVSAGVIGVGTGPAGSTAGSLSMTGLTASGASVVLSGLGSDAATTSATICKRTDNNTLVTGSGTIGICLGTSSARFKHDVLTETRGIDHIYDLRPVEYKYNGSDRALYGFIAEEVAGVMPELVGFDGTGKANTVDMLGMVPFLVDALKDLRGEINALKAAR